MDRPNEGQTWAELFALRDALLREHGVSYLWLARTPSGEVAQVYCAPPEVVGEAEGGWCVGCVVLPAGDVLVSRAGVIPVNEREGD